MKKTFAALRPLVFGLGLGAVMAWGAAAQSPFAQGWILDPVASDLNVMSIKKTNVAESSAFVTFSGVIGEDGQTSVRVLTDSIDTKIDLRNVRMRFLLFESFRYPEAVISTRLDPAQFEDLPTVRRKTVDLAYTMDLHGVVMERTDPVTVTLLDNDTVAVVSTRPIPIKVEDFNLLEGLGKLQEAAGVEIVPVGTISFNFTFRRAGAPTLAQAEGAPAAPPVTLAAVTPDPAPAPGAAALETKGTFDREACLGRFEILSRTGNIYFSSGSARLAAESDPLLLNLADIVRRCPEMRVEIAGHTDSDGGEVTNQRLSEARAGAVAAFLTAEGIPADRLRPVGYGEARPLVPNDSAANKRRNRRIEFIAF